MKAKLTLKEIIIQLLEALEYDQCRTAAMAKILTDCPDKGTRATWKAKVKKLMDDPDLKKSAHALFEPIYAHILEASDETDLAGLLAQWPTKGRVN